MHPWAYDAVQHNILIMLFVDYRRKMNHRIEEITRRAKENGPDGYTPRPRSVSNAYAQSPNHSMYEELSTFGLPLSIKTLSIPDVPDSDEDRKSVDKTGETRIVVPQRGSNGIGVPHNDPQHLNPSRLSALEDGGYLHPTPEPVRKADQRAVDNPYSPDIGDGGSPTTTNVPCALSTFSPGNRRTKDKTEPPKDVEYLHPINNPDGADGVHSPIWHTGVDSLGPKDDPYDNAEKTPTS